jgi:hypothetical protein
MATVDLENPMADTLKVMLDDDFPGTLAVGTKPEVKQSVHFGKVPLAAAHIVNTLVESFLGTYVKSFQKRTTRFLNPQLLIQQN